LSATRHERNRGYSDSQIAAAVAAHLPGRRVQSVEDRGAWIRRILYLQLDDGQRVVLKVQEHPEWGAPGEEAAILRLLRQHGLPAPRPLAVDTTCSILPPFVLEEHIGGVRWGDLRDQYRRGQLAKSEWLKIHEAIGAVYSRFHELHHVRSGVPGKDPYELKYDILPTDFMFRAEILGGSGKQAVNTGLISSTTYAAVVRAWRDNLDYLKQHKPTLVHLSSFYWTVYLSRVGGHWDVTKLTALSDVAWWDRAFNLALLRYPPFGHTTEQEWAAFVRGYGDNAHVEERRLLLYVLMQRLCAMSGVYMEPEAFHNKGWIEQAADEVGRFVALLSDS